MVPSIRPAQPAIPVKEEGSVFSHVARLSDICDRLDGAVNGVRDRYAQVLIDKPRVEQDGGPEPHRENSSQLGSHLAGLVLRLESIVRRLAWIIEDADL